MWWRKAAKMVNEGLGRLASWLGPEGEALPSRLRLARGAEQQVAEYLRREGWQVLGCNVRCRSGEVDVVAREGETLVMVEVKAGVGRGSQAPAVRVGSAKRRKLARLAEEVQRQRGLVGQSVRVDVVEVLTDDQQRTTGLNHYRGVVGHNGRLT
jgi:putative endonuclease